MTASDKQYAGSNSKLVTAAATLRLAEQGKLDLDDPVSKWFPKLREADKVTVGMLLTQRSGVPNYLESPAWASAQQTQLDKPWPQNKPVEVAEKMPRANEPGEAFNYSNTNYQLLSSIVSKVAGMSFPRAMDTLVFEPAGVGGAATFDAATGASSATVVPYAQQLDGSNRQDISVIFASRSLARSVLNGDGGMVASAPALAKLGKAIMWDKSPFLRASSRKQARHEADTLATNELLRSMMGIDGYGPGM